MNAPPAPHNTLSVRPSEQSHALFLLYTESLWEPLLECVNKLLFVPSIIILTIVILTISFRHYVGINHNRLLAPVNNKTKGSEFVLHFIFI